MQQPTGPPTIAAQPAAAASSSSSSTSSSDSVSITSSSFSSSSSSNRLIYLRPGHEYNQLPADLIYLIAQHLDGRSLARLGSCDRTSQAATQKPQLWQPLTRNTTLQAEWLDLGGLGPPLSTLGTILQEEMQKYRMEVMVRVRKEKEAGSMRGRAPPSDTLHPRHEYITRHYLVTKLRGYASEKWKQQYRGRWRVRLVRFVEEVLMGPFMIVLIGWQLFNLILVLDAPVSVPAPAHALASASLPLISIMTFLPLLLVTFLILFSFLNLYYIKWRIRRRSSPRADACLLLYTALSGFTHQRRFLSNSYFSSSQTIIASISRAVARERHGPEQHSLLISIVLMIALFVVLLVLRITETISSLHWFFIFLPFYLAFLLHQFGCYRFDWYPIVYIRNTMSEGHTSWSPDIMIYILTTFVIGLNLWLMYREEYFRTFHYILSPIYFLFISITCIWSWLSIYGDRESKVAVRTVGFPMWVIGLLPMTRTAIWISQKMDGYEQSSLIGVGSQIDLTWRNILMPLWVPLTCLFIRSLLHAKADFRRQQFEEFLENLRDSITTNRQIKFDMPTEVRSNK